MTFPVFASGDVLNASDMNAVGLWLVKTQTIGSAVSSVAVTGAFSADFDNYRIIVSGGAGSSADAGLTLRVGAKTTGYRAALYYQDYTNAVVATVLAGTNETVAYVGRSGTNGLSAVIDITAPNLAKNTSIIGHGSNPSLNVWGINNTNDTTQYTDFTILVSAGTVTGGTIKVYGYRN